MRRYASLYSIRCATLKHVSVAVVVPHLCAFYYYYTCIYIPSRQLLLLFFVCVCMIVGVGSEENEERRGKSYEF